MELFKDYCIVKVKDIFLEKAVIIEGGEPIIINPSFNPEYWVETSGIVTSVPKVLSREPLYGGYVGQPGYTDDPPYEFKSTADIVQEVRVGDRVYFHRNCLLPNHEQNRYNQYYVFSKTEKEGGEDVNYHYFMIKYRLIYAAVRYVKANSTTPEFQWFQEKSLKPYSGSLIDEENGEEEKIERFFLEDDGRICIYKKEIDMIGSWIFVEANEESIEDVAVPTPIKKDGKVVLDSFGKAIMKPKEEWIRVKAIQENKYLHGWVRYIGTPLKGEPLELRVGSYVYFRPLTDTLITFEGKPYFRMLQIRVLAEVPFKKEFFGKPVSVNG